MSLLDVVNENDKVIGKERFSIIHKRGLRHRSVNILITGDPLKEQDKKLLIARRSGSQEVSAYKLHPSVAGHVNSGQTYEEAALMEIQEELFVGMQLPQEVKGNLREIARYKNDTRPTNKENTCLFLLPYCGPFSLDGAETSELIPMSVEEIDGIIRKIPNKTTKTLRNAIERYKTFINSLKS